MNVNLDDEIEFKLITSSFQSNKIKLKSAFSILNYKKDVITFFERDIEEIIFAYIWNFTNCNYGVEDVLEICDFFIENNFHLTIIKLFEYFARICENLKLKNTPGISAQDRRKASVLEYSQFSLNFLFAYSINFRIKYFDNNGLSYLLTIVSNSKFMKTFHAERFVEFITMNINQLSKDSDLYKSQWLKLNAVHILLKISDEYDKFKIHCYSALSNIATDHQIETIPRIQDIIPVFAKQLNKASTEISLNSEGVEREKIQFYNEEDESLSQQYDVYHVTDDFDTNLKRSLTGILNTLYKLAVSTKIKYDLFVKFNVKDSIRSIILNGVEIEKKYALKLLSQLSFDDQVMDILSKDIELLKFIENLSYNSNCTVHSLPKICKQLLWSLNTSKIVIGNQKMKKLNNNNNQIMISYNASSRDICMKIKRSLTQVGYNVWMDINEIHGSGFESMARAVETSDIILMCVTEKYRQSLNCQAEAQYAFKLKKTIIPIILQNDYEHIDGWLGKLLKFNFFSKN